MKFNVTTKRAAAPTAINLAGGQAFAQSAKLELVSILLTSTLQDQFYRSADVTAARIKTLIGEIDDKSFVAKAAVYARTQAGMRSVSHLVAGELAKRVKGEPWTKAFYDRVVHRVDDALEILAYYLAAHGRPVPNSLKKGLGAALARFDEHQLAKHRRDRAEISLVDAVNLLHPPHTEALRKLVNGSLAAADTWETKLTQAGATAEGDEAALAENKSAAWAELIANRKLGYFALLRNLRNILEQSADARTIDAALEMLADEQLIRRSLVLPFRFLTALEALEGTNLPRAADAIAALNRAVDLSLANAPRFEGKTLVALDTSGSMMGRPLKIGALFAATLLKANDADLLLFSTDAEYATLNRADSTLSLVRQIEAKAAAAGTNFHAIFERANRAYERVVIFSDMQGWVGHYTPRQPFEAYKARCGAAPHVFSFDLAGHGTLQFPEAGVYCLAGFSDKTMDTLRFLESDKTALLQEIAAVRL